MLQYTHEVLCIIFFIKQGFRLQYLQLSVIFYQLEQQFLKCLDVYMKCVRFFFLLDFFLVGDLDTSTEKSLKCTLKILY